MPDARNLRGLALLLVAGLAGCASPSVPKPPSLRLPSLAKGVTSDRVGNQVTVRWTTPTETTDKLKVKPPIHAVVCREDSFRTAPPAPELKVVGKPLAECLQVAAADVMPGASELSFPLPPQLVAAPTHAVALRVELQNNLGRSAGRSERTFVASGPAPGPVEGLQFTSTPSGILVRWRSTPGAAPVELHRLLISSPVPPKPKSADPTKTASEAGAPKPPVPPVPIVLRAPSSDSSNDPGGMLDPGVLRGGVYRYSAQRVLELDLSAQKLVVRGPESAPVVFAMRDTFPPATPTGLAAVPGPGSIDLSWEPNSDADLAGYFVYRRTGDRPDSPETRLTAEPVPSPAYRDTSASSGVSSHYRVTAVDSSGNESKPSAEVVLTPP